jgi:hypothetical protein
VSKPVTSPIQLARGQTYYDPKIKSVLVFDTYGSVRRAGVSWVFKRLAFPDHEVLLTDEDVLRLIEVNEMEAIAWSAK